MFCNVGPYVRLYGAPCLYLESPTLALEKPEVFSYEKSRLAIWNPYFLPDNTPWFLWSRMLDA